MQRRWEKGLDQIFKRIPADRPVRIRQAGAASLTHKVNRKAGSRHLRGVLPLECMKLLGLTVCRKTCTIMQGCLCVDDRGRQDKIKGTMRIKSTLKLKANKQIKIKQTNSANLGSA